MAKVAYRPNDKFLKNEKRMYILGSMKYGDCTYKFFIKIKNGDAKTSLKIC